MIKSIKIKNTSSYLEDQEIVFFNSFEDKNKKINYIFGPSASGKSSLFKILKATIYYMKRWITFDEGDIVLSVNKHLNLKHFFNPNLHSDANDMENATSIEIVFANETWDYKYELSFHEHACNLERFSYRKIDEKDWILIFSKTLLSCDEIDFNYESFFNYEINTKELGLDFKVSMEHRDLNDSIFSYIVSLDKSQNIKQINKIIDNILFFDAKNFTTLNNFLFPYAFFLENKTSILGFLKELGLNYSDLSLKGFNKIAGTYDLNLHLNRNDESVKPKYISSSSLSKGELKLLILSFMYYRYFLEEKIIFIDEFSSKMNQAAFIGFLNILERISKDNKSFQLIFWNGEFLNEVKNISKNGLINIFKIYKTEDNNSEIVKVTSEELVKEKREEIINLKKMLNFKNNYDYTEEVKSIYFNDLKNGISKDLTFDINKQLHSTWKEEMSKNLASYSNSDTDWKDEDIDLDILDEIDESEIAKMSKKDAGL